jgi:magnesium chelatase family protein
MLEKSADIRKRVTSARQVQSERFKDLPIQTNSEMHNKQLRKFCQLDNQSDRLLKQAIDQFQLSARAYFRLIKIARTIADLADEESITSAHIAEALQYRIKG